VKARVFWGHFAEGEYRRVVVKAIDFQGNEMMRLLLLNTFYLRRERG